MNLNWKQNSKAAGEWVRIKRLKKGITQQALADMVKVSRVTISNIENSVMKEESNCYQTIILILKNKI